MKGERLGSTRQHEGLPTEPFRPPDFDGAWRAPARRSFDSISLAMNWLER